MSAGFGALLKQVAQMSKNTTVRTSGIIGDDLSLNSKQLIGTPANRKVPIVAAVAKGSLKNKALLIPAALALSVACPAAIMPLLTSGGAYLCYDGIEKILHKDHETSNTSGDTPKDPKAEEKEVIKKATKIDMILSSEIVVVSLWTVAAAPLLVQAGALIASGIAMSVGVYGLVGGFIKMDDAGAALLRKSGDNLFDKACRMLGKGLVKIAPPMIKTVGVVGTAAMFLVGGGMVMHGIPGLMGLFEKGLHAVIPGGLLQGTLTLAAEAAAGIVAGFAALPLMKGIVTPLLKHVSVPCKSIIKKIKRKRNKADKVTAAQTLAAPQTKTPGRPLKDIPSAKTALNNAAPRPPKQKKSQAKPAQSSRNVLP